jgi:uncharacterized protein YecT (DUF1311 family)
MKRIIISLIAVLSATPAFALDCSKAKTPVEKAICADPAAADADRGMVDAYAKLAAGLLPDNKKTLLASQRAWLKLRGILCERDNGIAAACLTKTTVQRSRYLSGLPETGPGSGSRLVPVFREESSPRLQYEIDVNALKFEAPALPGEKLFNTRVDKLLADLPKNEPRQKNELPYSSSLSLSMTYASPGFLSAHIKTYDFSGGAHGNNGTGNINIDVARGKAAAFGDLFTPEAKRDFEDACWTQFEKQKADKGPDETMSAEDRKTYRATIKESVAALENWSFSASNASIGFDPYALGAYAEGTYSCDFDEHMLKRLRKPDSLLPLP